MPRQPIAAMLCLIAAMTGLAAFGVSAMEVETARMTSPEIRDAIASGATTILIPTGGTEQNGAHMVTGKHNVVVAETARRIARELGQTLVAPVLAYTPEGDIARRNGHMAHAGTVSVTPEAFAGILDGAARSFAAHGFTTIVFLGDSGPNQRPQRAVADRLSGELAGVRVLSADAYYATNGQMAALLADGETEASIGAHAGIRDTSELMAIDPSGVRADRLAEASPGASGAAARASAARGERMLSLKVAAAVAEIRAARAAPARAPAASAPPGFAARVWRLIFG